MVSEEKFYEATVLLRIDCEVDSPSPPFCFAIQRVKFGYGFAEICQHNGADRFYEATVSFKR